jgi:hypothetical protein
MKGTNEKEGSSDLQKDVDCASNKAGGSARAGQKDKTKDLSVFQAGMGMCKDH